MKELPTYQALVDSFSKLPGVGGKSAQRMAFSGLEMDESEAQKAIDILAGYGDKATVIGSVTATPGVDIKLL